MKQGSLKGKLLITANLTLDTGLHIGGNNDFSPIGAVDSTFVRDTLTKRPIIPGSSLKGKIRSLLRRNEGKTRIEEESLVMHRLFGFMGSEKEGITSARLQFFDVKMTEDSVRELKSLDTDTYLGEIKFENSIDSITGQATPRQIERVPAGAVFDFKLVYNVYNIENQEIKDDINKLADGVKLLEWDYLGSSGSRGYGRVKFMNWNVELFGGDQLEDGENLTEKVKAILEEV